MSINSAMAAAVSGLVANSSALSAISDNIANSNTVGYKQNNTEFEDLLTASSAANNYNAGGVAANTTQLVTQQGDLQQTSSSTDLGISGTGFFVVATTDDPTASSARAFTRAGSFTVDASGDLQNAAGYYLQGWPVNSDGSVTVDPSDLNSLQSINVGDVGGTAAPTTQVAINANLDSAQTTSTAASLAATDPTNAAAYNAQSYSMASGDVTPDATINVPISDSQGGQKALSLDLLKSSTANTWYAELVANPASDVQYGTGSTLSNGQVATGTLTFNADGSIDMADSTLFGGVTDPTVSLGASASGASLTGNKVAWATDLGLGAQSIAFNLSEAPGGITQLNSASVTESIDANGTQFGNLTSVAIDDQGFVTASYSNGISKQIAQVALATFQNPDGLKGLSGDAYQVSSTSGSFNLKTPGSGGAGTISPSTLEASTVDLSSQFSNLITTQEAYSASAKVITTADQMLQSLLNIKQ